MDLDLDLDLDLDQDLDLDLGGDLELDNCLCSFVSIKVQQVGALQSSSS